MANPTKKPTVKVGPVSKPARQKGGSGRKMKSTWKVPGELTKSSSQSRATKIETQWVLARSRGGALKQTSSHATNYKSSTVDLSNMSAKNSAGKSVSLTRSSYYPKVDAAGKEMPKLLSVACRVRGKNSKGDGPWREAVAKFAKPFKPTISELEQDHDTGRVKCTVTAYDSGTTLRERYDTRYRLEVYDSRVATPDVSFGTFTGDEQEVWTDVSDRYGLSYSDYIRVSVWAMSRGFAGMSDGKPVGIDDENAAWRKAASYYVSYPALPALGTPYADVPDGVAPGATDKVIIPIQTNDCTEHPVSGVRLYRLTSTSYETPEQAALVPLSEWGETDCVDDGTCQNLSLQATELPTDPGTVTWVRVKAWNDWEGPFVRWSAPVRVKCLERSVASATSSLAIGDVTPGEGGNSLVVTIGWNDGTTPDTGTELSWSEDPNAWRSTQGPTTYEFEWDDGEPVTIDGVVYAHSAVVHVLGLSEGTRYYVRARRYLSGDSGSVFGAYAGPKQATTTSQPTTVVLAPVGIVPAGSDVVLTWTYDADAPQTAWRLYAGTVDDDTDPWLTEYKIVDKGEDGRGTYVLSADELSSLQATYSPLLLAVGVCTGGAAYIDSETVTVLILEAPVIGMTVPETLTAQPLSVSLTADLGGEVAIVVSAHGCGADEAVGIGEQAEGDCVWTGVLTPDWQDESVDLLSATVLLPSDLDLRDGARYMVEAVATDRTTGLTSNRVTATFDVDWDRKAPSPPSTIEVVPSDETDAAGVRRLSCEIRLAPPPYETEGEGDGDTYDVWCVTPDGIRPLVTGVATDAVVTDPWAPYGGEGLAYRVVLRTEDGDTEWADYGYSLPASMLRVEFGGRYVELPYNMGVADSFEKDFEARRKLSGDIDGYWGPGASRKASLKCDVAGIEDWETARDVRDMGQYAGACLVRTPDGCRYQADVQLSDLSTQDGAIWAVSLDVTEVSPTGEFAGVVAGESEAVDPDEEV